MMNRKLVALSALVVMMGAIPASAITVTDLYGDKDGFGTGVAEGELFFPWDVVTEADDEGFTDRWVYGDQSWSHSYDISGFDAITSASITVLSGGQGLGVAKYSQLYIDGNFAGNLTDGEIAFLSFARKDVFDLTSFAGLLSGSNTLEIRTFYDIDAWVLDYSEITITGTEATNTNPNAPVPEPATMTLLGLGLAGLAMRKRGIRA